MNAIAHGTRSGYMRCIKRPEGSCEPCRRANNDYAREHRRRRSWATYRRALDRLAQRHAEEFHALLEQERTA